MKPGVEVLRDLPLFATCTPAVLARLNDIADLARVGPDETLFREGDRLDELNILLSGYAITTRSQPNGDEVATDVVEPIRPIAVSTTLLGGLAPLGARTVTSARVIVISAPELCTMIRKVPGLRTSFFNHALNDLRELAMENSRLKLCTSTQRLAGYLLSLANDPEASPARFVLPFAKRFLAARIGCSQVNLSRAFAALRAIGVSTRAGVVVIKEIPVLRDYAGLSPTSRNGPKRRAGQPAVPILRTSVG
jgi:CRP/FNR family transcriptional regulator, dissimilatory nitrate respiration regulator